MLKGNTNAERIWNYFADKGLSQAGIAGLMGNLYAESALNPQNLQNSFEGKLGYTDSSYTAAVDKGSYTNFAQDKAGYGLAQWTYWSRKQNLLNFARAAKKSIGDLEMQLDFLWHELSNGYSTVLSVLKTSTSVRTASDSVLLNFERPANQSESVQVKRAGYGQKYYGTYAKPGKEGKTMSNSKLVDCTVYSPNHSGKRTHSIDTLTPHCVVGQLAAETIGACFPKGRDASCNYGIGKDGRVCLIVDECNRSWCSSSSANDQRAITIECASDKTHPYAMTDAVYEKLIQLCVDICQRYGKTKVLWLGSKEKTLAYTPKSDEMVLTAHRWFANKACPGEWLYSRYGALASEITKRLGGKTTVTDKPTTNKATMYRVRKSWKESSTQKGAFTSLANAKACADKNPGYSVFDENGQVVYPVTFKSYLVRVTTDVLNIRKGPGTNYGTNGSIKNRGVYTIVEEANGTGATKWGKLKSGAGWISLDYVKRV